MSLKLTTADGESCFQDFLVSENDTRACLKNHSRNLHAPLCGIFHPNSVAVAHYGALIRAKYPTNCDAHLAESLFQTRSNLKAHFFISEQYWISNYEFVKEMLPQAEVYVYEDDKMIQGFIGVSDEYIEGIFVSDEMQSCGIGKMLLDYIKDKKDRLQLKVYQKNVRAMSFYQREGFTIQSEEMDEFTGEKEYVMNWELSGI